MNRSSGNHMGWYTAWLPHRRLRVRNSFAPALLRHLDAGKAPPGLMVALADSKLYVMSFLEMALFCMENRN